MYSYLKGIIIEKSKESVILNVNNIGFEVFLPYYLLIKIKLKDKDEFWIDTVIKENDIKLYGFSSKQERYIFRLLRGVSGIGPKSALSIISQSAGCAKIINAVQEADVSFFQSIKGIGKKNSQKLIIELKSKIGSLKELEIEREINEDLKQALLGLGFNSWEINEAIKGLNQSLPLEEQIRFVLRKKQIEKNEEK